MQALREHEHDQEHDQEYNTCTKTFSTGKLGVAALQASTVCIKVVAGKTHAAKNGEANPLVPQHYMYGSIDRLNRPR